MISAQSKNFERQRGSLTKSKLQGRRTLSAPQRLSPQTSVVRSTVRYPLPKPQRSMSVTGQTSSVAKQTERTAVVTQKNGGLLQTQYAKNTLSLSTNVRKARADEALTNPSNNKGISKAEEIRRKREKINKQAWKR